MRAEAVVALGFALALLAACDGAGNKPARDLGVDSGSYPLVPFAPRLLFEDPSVRCEVPPPPAMRPATTPRPTRGAVRWVFNPSRDPATLAALAGEGRSGLGLTGEALTGMASGGFVTTTDLGRYYLGVNGDGEFALFGGAGASRYGATWLMPSTYINRPHQDVRLDLYDAVDRSLTRTAALTSLPGGYPGTSEGDIEFVGPAVLPDGTIAWLPTTRTLAASCPDGRLRWVMEFYNPAAVTIPAIFAAGDGNIILARGFVGIHRIDPGGRVLASRPLAGIDGGAMGFSDRCGVALLTPNPAAPTSLVLKYFSGTDFSTERELPPEAIPTNDCGWWSSTPPPSTVWSRYRPDGTLAFVNPGRSPSLTKFELADGTWLMVDRGGSRETPPGMSIVSDDGTLVFDTAFDTRVVGEDFKLGAYLLTPDGVLYVTATSGFEAVQQFVAIEVGVGEGSTWARWSGAALRGDGGNWTRDNATWHPTPAL